MNSPNRLKNDLVELQKKLIELTERWLKMTECGKISEPSIYIGVTNNWTWFAEIYSYQMDFYDGGRHHYFEADTYEELIDELWKAIKEEERKLERYERDNDE